MTDEDFEALAARYFAARAEFNAAHAKFEPVRNAYFAELARRYWAAYIVARKETP